MTSRVIHHLSSPVGHPPLMTVLEGDCRECLQKIPDASVDLIVTDPPYGIEYQSHRPKAEKRKAKIEGDQGIFAIGILNEIKGDFYRVLKPDAHAYVFCDLMRMAEVAAVFWGAGFEWRSVIVWGKGQGMGDRTGQSYVHAYETALFLTKGDRKLNNHPADLIWVGRTVKAGAVHATQKDLMGLVTMIEASSRPGDLVLDPFAGSGSTGSAAVMSCEQPRRVILIEKDPKMANLCRRRMAVHGEVKTSITPLESPHEVEKDQRMTDS